jgi:VanZ family protein
LTKNRFLPAIAWLMLSLVLFCVPGSTFPKSPLLAVFQADKWAHFILFFILCFLFARPFRNSGIEAAQRHKWFLSIMLLGIGYGVIIEFVQKYWIPNRSFETWDIVAGSAGCFLAWLNNKRLFIRTVP